MRDFEYEAPTNLQSALALFAEHSESARALAGGTALIDQVRLGRLTPDLVVDLKKLQQVILLEKI